MFRIAPAKLNRYLAVLGKLEDGFHEVELVTTVLEGCGALSDGLEVTLGERRDLYVFRGPWADEVEPDDSNLILKAWRLIEKKLNRKIPININLEKNIPVGAGLGGGSSDAAALIKMMPDLLGIPLEEAEQIALAAQVGSDVPLFILGGTSFGQHKGEKVTRLLPALIEHELIIHSGVMVATQKVYERIPSGPFNTTKLADPNQLGGIRRNDLTPFAFAVAPILQVVSKDIIQTKGDPLLCGSGGCMSAKYATRVDLEAAKAWFKTQRPYYQIYDLQGD